MSRAHERLPELAEWTRIADERHRAALLVKADRPMDAEELAERIAAMVGVPPVTAGARALSGAGSR